MKHPFITYVFVCFFLKIFSKDGNILEVSVTFCNILELSGTFHNIVELVIKEKSNHPMYTSEVLVTVYVKLLLGQYYACTMSVLCKSNNR